MPEPTCVIYNPAAGRGRARARIAAALPRLGPDVTLRATAGPGHAAELAEAAAREGFARVVAAGGDGTVHEVANGLLRAARPGVVLSTLPLGSMNDYAHALGLGRWWAGPPPGPPLAVARVDVGVLRAGGRERFFVNGVGVGFNGMVTLESRAIRRLRGPALYTLAFLRAGVRHFRQPEVTITFAGGPAEIVRRPTLALTVNIGQREGGFPVTPAARLDDGLFDTFHVTGLRRWHLLRYLPALLAGTLPDDHPLMRRRRTAGVAVQAAEGLAVHADGELVCVPGDGVGEVDIAVRPGGLTVEVCPALRPGETKR